MFFACWLQWRASIFNNFITIANTFFSFISCITSLHGTCCHLFGSGSHFVHGGCDSIRFMLLPFHIALSLFAGRGE